MIHDLSFGSSGKKKIVWLTDLHIDAAEKTVVNQFLGELVKQKPDFLLIGGDISTGIFSLKQLAQLDKLLSCPIFFVLGNHDFYHHSIAEIRREAHALCLECPRIHYLTEGTFSELTPTLALVGHDSWSDARAGDFLHSEVMLNDYFLIEDLKSLSQERRFKKLHQLGDEAVSQMRPMLQKALAKYPQVILLTHTPSFEEVCFYQGRQSDPQWIPHFVCRAMGEMLREEMAKAPKSQLLVLCGHTHYGDDKLLMPNMRVVTGHSVLGSPTIQGFIHI